MRRAALAAAFLAAAAPARAADFTFRVPVNIQDYERLSSLPGGEAIVCEVIAPGSRTTGMGSTPLPISPSGNLNTTVAVEVNVTPPARPQDATDYRCYFLLANAPRVTAEQALATTLTSSSIYMRARPGTTPVVVVTGKIPK